MKRKSIVFFLFIILFILSGCTKKDIKGLKVVVTSFPVYDMTRGIKGDSKNIKMLIKPGAEVHSFDPTPEDIKDILNSDLFIYIGGESDRWLKDILKEINPKKTKVIKLIDYVKTYQEEKTLEEKDELELDEHIWTDPLNYIKLMKEINKEISKKDHQNKDKYYNNMKNYIDKIITLDNETKEVIMNSKKKELVVADHFPFLYFVKHYNLKYIAAFSGCSDQIETSPKAITTLITKVKEENISVIIKRELSNDKLARIVAKETKTKVLVLDSAHNLSLEDFNHKKTYLDIMKHNKEVLKEALN